MLGGIYSDERCPICRGKFRDNGKTGLTCPEHPQCHAIKLDVRIRGVHLTFRNYELARHVLNGINFKIKERTFDCRDYQKDSPLGLQNLSSSFLDFQKAKRSYKKMVWHLGYARAFFHNQNIKEIAEGELDDFYRWLPSHLSSKTKKNIFNTPHCLWVWVKRREKKRTPGFEVPEFPVIAFESKWRKIVDKETQLSILEEIKRLTYDLNPRIYLGCLWLTTYSHIRGIELLNIKEKDVDLKTGRIEVYRTKEKNPRS